MTLSNALLLDPYPCHVWIARRTDGNKGSGKTINDPFDGGTAARFDAFMNSLPANSVVHLGPGTFYTAGYSDDVATGGFQPKAGMKIIGSGIDVTTLQLASNAQTVNGQLFAIGHALAAGGLPNTVDAFEVRDLTVDCNLEGQTGAGSQVACGAVRIMGSHVKIERVKAIHWGTKTAGRSCYVLTVITGHVVGLNVAEVANCGIEECIAISPTKTSGSYFGPVTVLHAGGKEAAKSLVESYGRGPYIRNCHVDPSLDAAAADFRALSMGWCKSGVVEGNQVYNTKIGGPYQEITSSRDLVVRENYYKNVMRGPYWKLGAVEPTTPVVLPDLTYDDRGPIDFTVALAITTDDPNNLQAGERVKIDVPAGNPIQYKGWFAIQEIVDTFRFSYQMVSAVSQPVADGPTMQKVMGVNRLVVENNLIELATGTAALAAIQVDDGGTPGQAAPLPDYVHGDVVIQANKIRYLDGLFDTAYTGYGIEVNGTKNLTVKDNIVESAVTHPIRNSRCGSATYFNNTTPSGALIQGWNQDQSKPYDELKTQAEDAFLLAYMERS